MESDVSLGIWLRALICDMFTDVVFHSRNLACLFSEVDSDKLCNVYSTAGMQTHIIERKYLSITK